MKPNTFLGNSADGVQSLDTVGYATLMKETIGLQWSRRSQSEFFDIN